MTINDETTQSATNKRTYKSFFQRNFSARLRRGGAPSSNKFQTPPSSKFLRRASKESTTQSESSSLPSENVEAAATTDNASTTSSVLCMPPVPSSSSRLGIQPTAYDIPEEPFAYQQGGGRGIVSPEAETEVVFFGDEDQSSFEGSYSLFGKDFAPYKLDLGLSPKKFQATNSSPEGSNIPTISSGPNKIMPPVQSSSVISPHGKATISAETQRKAKEIVDRARQRQGLIPVAPVPADSTSSSVKIFLLLLDPRSKIFELIVLSYPRKNTTIGDILRMVPKNATEQVLKHQTYIGITRPQRRAELVTDLKMMASNHVNSALPTAGIVQREIILALPAHTDSRKIVSLGKQILANEHIQSLMAKTNQPKRKRIKRNTSKGSLSSKSTRSRSSELATPTAVSPAESIHHKEIGSPNSSFHKYCELEMKRAVEKANVANEQVGRSPCGSPKRSPASKGRVVDFPADMMQAYMSNETMIRMCGGGNKRGLDHRDSSSDIRDDVSYDGSLASSFQSWSMSVDTSCTTQKVPTMATPRLRKKKVAQHMRNLRRLAFLSFLASIVWYNYDPNGLENAGVREEIKMEPMGCVGFITFLLSFVSLLKLQRFVTRPISYSKCPVLQMLSQRIAEENTATGKVKMF